MVSRTVLPVISRARIHFQQLWLAPIEASARKFHHPRPCVCSITRLCEFSAMMEDFTAARAPLANWADWRDAKWDGKLFCGVVDKRLIAAGGRKLC